MTGTSRTTITLRNETLDAVHDLVDVGDFASADDAVLAAIDAWRETREDQGQRLQLIREKVRHAIDDPRPDFSIDEIDAALDLMMREAKSEAGRAAG
uniref:ribbon-helix-helix domain-containing protein n=2 Tax=Rhizobium TaxID=379 RepID=UPI00261A2DAD|nr:type II toxin-antitoxin system ParD family antitoxin [uncultured Rhizobium sp.]